MPVLLIPLYRCRFPSSIILLLPKKYLLTFLIEWTYCFVYFTFITLQIFWLFKGFWVKRCICLLFHYFKDITVFSYILFSIRNMLLSFVPVYIIYFPSLPLINYFFFTLPLVLRNFIIMWFVMVFFFMFLVFEFHCIS